MYPDSVCEGLCSQCTAKFGKPKGGAGKLVFLPDNVYCPVCWEDKPGVKQAFCEHTLCTDCFRDWYFAVADPPPAPRLVDWSMIAGTRGIGNIRGFEIVGNAGRVDRTFWINVDTLPLFMQETPENFTAEDARPVNVGVVRCPLCRRG